MNIVYNICDTEKRMATMATIGVYLINASASTMHALPFLYPYIGQYFNGLDHNVEKSSGPLIATIYAMTEALFICVSMFSHSKFGIKKTCLAVLGIQFILNILASFCTNFGLFALLFGIGNSMASGASLYISMYCVWRYFPEKLKHQLTGVISASYVIFCLISINLAFIILGPADQGMQADMVAHMPTYIRILAFCYLATGMIGLFIAYDPIGQFIRDKHQATQTLMPVDMAEIEFSPPPIRLIDTYHPNVISKEFGIINTSDKDVNFSDLFETFRDGLFLQILVARTLSFVGTHFFLFTFLALAVSYFESSGVFFVILPNLAILMHTGSRFIGGSAYEYLGFMKLHLIVAGTIGLSLLLLIASDTSKLLYLVAVLLFYTAAGIGSSAYPVAMHHAFGKEAETFRAVAYCVENAIGCLLAYLLRLMLPNPNMDHKTIYILAGMTVLSIVLAPNIQATIYMRMASGIPEAEIRMLEMQ